MPFSEPPPAYDFIPHITPDHPHPIVAEWQAHVDAGRIGNRQPMDPAVRASILAAERVLCRRRVIR
jgi:hypothetical protein